VGSRRFIVGMALVGVGFGLWAMNALAFGSLWYFGTNLLRVAFAVTLIAGVLVMQRGDSPATFRAGIYGLLAVALALLVHNYTGAIQLPEDLSTLFGFAGALAAAYGARNWFEGGDSLAAAWIAGGFGLMAANPGLYVLLGLVRGDLWQSGWLPGSLIAFVGLVLAASSAPSLARRA
jgi:hypothetical protein